ncbi:MAG: class I SAM-dependent methyltransferase [Flavobacteriales bacterium]|nr:class I SAM-dependent methyltransferase [Flavobacteriales bacterium]
MSDHQEDFEVNRKAWNARVKLHLASDFYDVDGFVAGRGSLTALELELLGPVAGRDLLHLQCHFGQDTLSLARLGAQVTGSDISDAAIDEARKLTERCGLKADWHCGNVLDRVERFESSFDVVFTSYGTIGWLPELRSWAANIANYLRPGGLFVFVEFHPVVWMFDNAFTRIQYAYFNRERIVEEEQGSYADRKAPERLASVSWNHDLAEVLTALMDVGLVIERFVELDGSPHACFENAVQGADGLYRIKGMEGRIPMVYGLVARKPG